MKTTATFVMTVINLVLCFCLVYKILYVNFIISVDQSSRIF